MASNKVSMMNKIADWGEDNEDDLEALRLAALQSLKTGSSIKSNIIKERGKGKVFRNRYKMNTRSNLITIVPISETPPIEATLNNISVMKDSNTNINHQYIEKNVPSKFNRYEDFDSDSSVNNSDDECHSIRNQRSCSEDIEGKEVSSPFSTNEAKEDSLETLMDQLEQEINGIAPDSKNALHINSNESRIDSIRKRKHNSSLFVEPHTTTFDNSPVTNLSAPMKHKIDEDKHNPNKPCKRLKSATPPHNDQTNSSIRSKSGSPSSDCSTNSVLHKSMRKTISPQSRHIKSPILKLHNCINSFSRYSKSPCKRTSRSPIRYKKVLCPSRKRSISPSNHKYSRNRVHSPLERRLSPRYNSRLSRSSSPRHMHVQISPRRKQSLSPRHHSGSPNRWSDYSRRRSPSLWSRSVSPKGRTVSPRRNVFSSRQNSYSPRRSNSIRRSRSPRLRLSPSRRTGSPSRSSNLYHTTLDLPEWRSISPRRLSISPRKCSGSPESFSASLRRQRSVSSKRFSLSPARRSLSPRSRSGSPRSSIFVHKLVPLNRRPDNSRQTSISPGNKSHSPRKRLLSPRLRSPLHKRPFSVRLRSPSFENRSLSPSSRPKSPRKRSITRRNLSTSPFSRSNSPRTRTVRNKPISPRERLLSPRNRIISERNRSISPRDRFFSLRKVSNSPRKRSISPRNRPLSPRKTSVSPRKRSATPRKRSVSPTNGSVSLRRIGSLSLGRAVSPIWKRSVSPRRKRSLSPRRKRSPSPRRKGSQSPRRKGSPSPRRKGSPSPRRKGSPSPRRKGSPSPRRKGSQSPRRKGSPSPRRKGSPSPRRKGSPSPRRKGSPSPRRKGSPSPRRKGSPSPRRKGSPSPRRKGSPSPRRKGSPSPRRKGSPSPRRKGSPSPRRKGSPSPRRKGSPSPRRKGSPSPRRKGSPSPRRKGSPSPNWKGSPSPNWKGSPSPRQKEGSISPRSKRTVSPRRKRSVSPMVKSSLSPTRKRSASPRNMNTSPQQPSINIQNRNRSSWRETIPKRMGSISPPRKMSASVREKYTTSLRRSSPLDTSMTKHSSQERPEFESCYKENMVSEWKYRVSDDRGMISSTPQASDGRSIKCVSPDSKVSSNLSELRFGCGSLSPSNNSQVLPKEKLFNESPRVILQSSARKNISPVRIFSQSHTDSPIGKILPQKSLSPSSASLSTRIRSPIHVSSGRITFESKVKSNSNNKVYSKSHTKVTYPETDLLFKHKNKFQCKENKEEETDNLDPLSTKETSQSFQSNWSRTPSLSPSPDKSLNNEERRYKSPLRLHPLRHSEYRNNSVKNIPHEDIKNHKRTLNSGHKEESILHIHTNKFNRKDAKKRVDTKQVLKKDDEKKQKPGIFTKEHSLRKNTCQSDDYGEKKKGTYGNISTKNVGKSCESDCNKDNILEARRRKFEISGPLESSGKIKPPKLIADNREKIDEDLLDKNAVDVDDILDLELDKSINLWSSSESDSENEARFKSHKQQNSSRRGVKNEISKLEGSKSQPSRGENQNRSEGRSVRSSGRGKSRLHIHGKPGLQSKYKETLLHEPTKRKVNDKKKGDPTAAVHCKIKVEKHKKNKSDSKRSEETYESTDASTAKDGDLRAELSRRRAERLIKAGSLDKSLPARLLQSAFQGVVGRKNTKNVEKSEKQTISKSESEKRAKDKLDGRRVMVLKPLPMEEEDHENVLGLSVTVPKDRKRGKSPSKLPIHLRLGLPGKSWDPERKRRGYRKVKVKRSVLVSPEKV